MRAAVLIAVVGLLVMMSVPPQIGCAVIALVYVGIIQLEAKS